MDRDQALKKLLHYCAYRERCHSEVRSKLLNLKVYGMDLEWVITELIEEDFLNEERFARLYAGGKFRINQWGKIKIQRELRRKKVNAYCISKGLSEIEEGEYLETLRTLLTKKLESYRGEVASSIYQKLTAYILQKGYEYSLAKPIISELLEKHN